MSLVVIDEITGVLLDEFADELNDFESLANFASLEAVEELWNPGTDTYEVRCVGTRKDSTEAEVFVGFSYYTHLTKGHTVFVSAVEVVD